MGHAGRQAAGREGLRRLLPCSEAKEDGGWEGRRGEDMQIRTRGFFAKLRGLMVAVLVESGRVRRDTRRHELTPFCRPMHSRPLLTRLCVNTEISSMRSKKVIQSSGSTSAPRSEDRFSSSAPRRG